MCLRYQQELTTVPSTVDMDAMQEALLASEPMRAGFDIERAEAPDFFPGFPNVMPIGAEPSDITELGIIVLGGPGEAPEFLAGLLSQLGSPFVESESGAVDLGPIDVEPTIEPEPGTVAALIIQLSDMPLNAKAYFGDSLISQVEKRAGCGGEYVRLSTAPVE